MLQGVRCELMERKSDRLSSGSFEIEFRTIDDELPAGHDEHLELAVDEVGERDTLPVFLHQQILRTGQAKKAVAEFVFEV